MAETIITANQIAENLTSSLNRVCPVCERKSSDGLVDLSNVEAQLRVLVEANALGANASAVCTRCLELFMRAKTQIESHATVFEQTSFVLPTPLRMNANNHFTGRGVTVAFLDSGFYPHPDLTQPTNRILAYHSIFESSDDNTLLKTTDVASWHGMMTSVVAAGNGYLSDGFYRGLAPSSHVVLVKIGRTGHIPDEHIE
ncbi:MAG: S8 family serine peptidase, partial [bacterium]